ncbi:MAG: hypothetical protein RIE53_08725 [Rhodothermales bacterium]
MKSLNRSDPNATVPYTPIDCGFHDRLEDYAVRRVPVDVVLEKVAVSGLITDVFARDGADWMVLQTATGTETIRLDRIRSVNGIPLPPDPTCRIR